MTDETPTPETEAAAGTVTIDILGRSVSVPAGATLLMALQRNGYDYLKGCGCRLGDCGECGVRFRMPDDPAIRRELSCITKVAPGMQILDVPFRWNLAFRQAQRG